MGSPSMGHVFPEGSAPSPIPSQRNVVLALEDDDFCKVFFCVPIPEQNTDFYKCHFTVVVPSK